MIKKTFGTQKTAKLPDIRFAQVGGKSTSHSTVKQSRLDSWRNLRAGANQLRVHATASAPAGKDGEFQGNWRMR
jgi:hypothetical protein